MRVSVQLQAYKYTIFLLEEGISLDLPTTWTEIKSEISSCKEQFSVYIKVVMYYGWKRREGTFCSRFC